MPTVSSNNGIELKALIDRRTWILSDVRIYTWARHDHLEELERQHIGGGNFTIVNGCFSVLNFLSKTFSYLQNGRKVGSEKSCFERFCLMLEFPLFLGSKDLSCHEQNQKHGKIWDTFRPTLAHMAWPGGPVVAFKFSEELAYDEVKRALEVNTTPVFFVTDSGGFGVYSDIFDRDISKWVGSLLAEIDTGAFGEENIRRTIEWIKRTSP